MSIKLLTLMVIIGLSKGQSSEKKAFTFHVWFMCSSQFINKHMHF